MKIFDYADLGRKRLWDYIPNGSTPEDDGIKPIIETDREVDIGDTLIIGDTAYSITSLHGKGGMNHTAYVEKLKSQKVFIDGEEPEDKDYTGQITCPYCGYEDGDSWEADDDEDECVCPCCGSVFSYQRNVTVEYCSQPVRKAAAVYLN